jgi:hypothetical protein
MSDPTTNPSDAPTESDSAVLTAPAPKIIDPDEGYTPRTISFDDLGSVSFDEAIARAPSSSSKTVTS